MSLRLHTSLPESHDAGPTPFTPLLLQPRLAISQSAVLTFPLSNLRLIGLHPTAPLSILGLRSALYIPLGSTGTLPLCGLCPPRPMLRTPTQLASIPLALVMPLFPSSLQVHPSSASYSIQACQARLRACLLLFSPFQQPVGLAHSHLILSRWQHHSTRTPSPYSSWYSLSSSHSQLRPHTSRSAMAVSPFFLSQESLGDSVLPAATPHQPTTSDSSFCFFPCYFSFLCFAPHFICLLGTPRIS